MGKTRTALSLLGSLFLFAASVFSDSDSLPLPAIGNPPSRESRQALQGIGGYHDSDDGTCRLPLPTGFCIKSRLVKGGPFYDAAANRIIRRPDQEFEDLCRGTRTIAVVQQLRGAVYPRETTTAESALRRVASDYLRQEVLEDGRYFFALPAEVSKVNGIERVRTILRNEYGQNKLLDYHVEYLRQDSAPVLVLTVKERQADVSTSYHGFVAKCFGDTIVAGYARFLPEENLAETEAQTVLASIAGIQVKELVPNVQLAQAVIGTWETSRTAGPGRYADARYVFGPNGRFARTVYLQGKVLGRGGSEPGDYEVFGNLISLRFDKDEAVSFPVRLEGNVLKLANQAYVRVR